MQDLTPERVLVCREVIEGIVRHARADAPLECCGLLLGARGRVSVALPARNELASPTRFRIHPEDHFAALRRARELGLAIAGAYHSHPATAPVPSARDLREADDPGLLHLIVGLPSGDVRGYRLLGGNFLRVEVVPFG